MASQGLKAQSEQGPRVRSEKKKQMKKMAEAVSQISPLRILVVVAAALGIGGGLWIAGDKEAADVAWALAVGLALAPLAVSVGRDLLAKKTGVDVIALLAMGGALGLQQYLAGAVVGVMLSGGQALERYAGERAKKELKALVGRAPRVVHRYENGKLNEPDIRMVARGDLLLVKPGEVVPVDGVVASENVVLDESVLSGESMPVEKGQGEKIQSGVVNAGGPFDMHALATSEASTYAGIVRLVASASANKAPFVRLADRYALWFLPLTLLVAAMAWMVSGDAVRALAVLVVATPCPLILAAPVAIVSGISRAASRGIIIKGGGALETLARAKTLVFDKTGTLTAGEPKVVGVEVFAGQSEEEILHLAGSLDQVSAHVFAGAIVKAAKERGLELEFPLTVKEHAGSGIEGKVGGVRVLLGKAKWCAQGGALSVGVEELRLKAARGGYSNVFVAIEGRIVGALVIQDPIRADTPSAMTRLRRAGITRIVLLSGDKTEVAKEVGASVGVDSVMAEKTPMEKVQAVLLERKRAVSVMVGDGINDAPALAAADVGVAMGARGASASSEAADVVIMVDRLDRVGEAVEIAARANQIAVQSVVAGMALSVLGMVLASVGVLPPVAGAIFQEAIDVAVVLNALRALGGGLGRKAHGA